MSESKLLHEQRGAYRRYLWLLRLSAPLLVLYTLWQALAARDLRYLRQRLGLDFGAAAAAQVWLHAASVGEANIAAVLVQALRAHNPRIDVLVSTTTPGGARVLQYNTDGTCPHCYLPIDWPFAVRRFIRRYKPSCLLVVETELWPSLFRLCAENQIDVLLVNGRLTPRRQHIPEWVQALYRATLTHTRAILAQSARDAATFVALGAPPGNVTDAGNLKFCVQPKSMAHSHPCANRRFVLAVSTHDDEEFRLASLWQNWTTVDRPLLVLAPRHPRRAAGVARRCKRLGFEVARHSRGAPLAATGVYIVDSLGNLAAFYTHCELVIMGGSWVTVGGHNFLEAAHYAKPIICGPHMRNYGDAVGLFLRHNALIQTQNTDELKIQLEILLTSAQQAKTVGANAQMLARENTRVINDYLSYLAPYLDHNKP